MAERKLLWSDRALNDYESLVDYLLEEWGEEITIRIATEIDGTRERIQNNPEHYPMVLKDRSIQRCVFSAQTSIYFRVTHELVEIVSLFDNRQNPDKLTQL